MRICILCEDHHVSTARAKAADILPKRVPAQVLAKFKSGSEEPDHLKVPVSPTGELPATHWFCATKVDEQTYQKMLAVQEHTIIEEAVPSEFLEKHGLKRINGFGPDSSCSPTE